MDLTQGSVREKQSRANKMMVVVGIISLIMTFGGLTSAFIVSSSRLDWLTELVLPSAFYWSTAIIVSSSLFLIVARRSLVKSQLKKASLFVALSLLAGFSFVASQFIGFQQIIDSGFNFTGPTSNVTMSYIYVITTLHIFHVVAGLISLFIVFIKTKRGTYTSISMTGFDMSAIFWHFVDLLWLYLFIFLSTF